MSGLPPFISRIAEAINQGKIPKAAAILRKAGADVPDYQRYHAEGLICAATGKVEQCMQLLQIAARQPGYLEPLYALAAVHFKLSQWQQAVAYYEQIIGQDDKDYRAYAGLAECLVANGEMAKALEFLKHAYTLNPDAQGLGLRIGRLSYEQGRYQDASDVLTKCWKDSPDSGQLALLLGQIKARLNKPLEALEYFAAVKDKPYEEIAAWRTAGTLVMVERFDEALKLIDSRIPSATSQKANLIALRGVIENMLGELDAAQASYRRAIDVDQRCMEAWNGICSGKPGSVTDDEIALLEKIALGNGNEEEKIQACFGMSKVYEKRKDIHRQMLWLTRGNDRKHAIAPTNMEGMKRQNQALMDVFSPDHVSSLLDEVDVDFEITPIFILGMPRSGTTLVEQIISAHPDVSPMGESYALADAIDQTCLALRYDNQNQLFSQPAQNWLPTMRELTQSYYREKVGNNPVHYITDKAINLFRYVGLLKVLFPNARFVALQRDPVDVCFGGYKQLFSYGQNFSYSYESLATTLSEYQKLIAFWQKDPSIPLHQVHYEQLVLEQEPVTRQLLEHVGLPWDSRCLSFQENVRAVTTASVGQVRKGLYAGAVQRWRRYGVQMNPLLEALGKQGIDPDVYWQNVKSMLSEAALQKMTQE